ncbi:MAG: hypothetical protein H6811_08420 [Phycisphaeraceae bacterium]|nr:hypothetical protein [Phycisphaeraceae bacterium]
MVLALLLACPAVAQPEPADPPPIGQIQITHNYLAELNADALAVPEDQRAWLIYRRAAVMLGRTPAIFDDPDSGAQWPPRPGQPGWDEAVSYIDDNLAAIALIHVAASMPRMGYVITDQLDPVVAAARAELFGEPFTPVPPSDNPAMTDILLPHLGHCRGLARTLVMDSRVALQRGEADRFVSDIGALANLGRHVEQDRILISTLVGFAIRDLATSTVMESLATDSHRFTPEELAALSARLLCDDADKALARACEAHRLWFLDALQRAFTLNDEGDGALDADAWLTMYPTTDSDGRFDAPITRFVLAGSAGRKAQATEYDKLFALGMRQIDGSPWNPQDWELSTECRRIRRAGSHWEMLPVHVLLPEFDRAWVSMNMLKCRAGFSGVAIALELFRREHGAYPASLDALVPHSLDSVPIDIFTGQSILYELTGGAPLLYSRGPDRDDDGGETGRVGAYPSLARWLNPLSEGVPPDGDWILYPPQEED